MKLIEILDSTRIPVGYRISFLTNFWREPLLRRMERKFSIIRPELTVLMCLNFHDGLHARDICEITEQPSNTVSRAVTALEVAGKITRCRDENDQRRMTLKLTEAGRSLHDAIMEEFSAAEAALLQTLTDEETKILIQLLDRLARDVVNWSSSDDYQSAFC